jgi:hypothetical protein
MAIFGKIKITSKMMSQWRNVVFVGGIRTVKTWQSKNKKDNAT